MCNSNPPVCMNDLMVLLGSSSRSQSLSSCPLHEQPYGEAVSQRKGEALPEGKVRRLLFETHCPITFPQTNIHSLTHPYTYMHWHLHIQDAFPALPLTAGLIGITRSWLSSGHGEWAFPQASLHTVRSFRLLSAALSAV